MISSLLTNLKVTFLHFNNLFSSCLATGRDTESLLVEVSPLCTWSCPLEGASQRQSFSYDPRCQSDLSISTYREMFFISSVLSNLYDQFWMIHINKATYRFIFVFCIQFLHVFYHQSKSSDIFPQYVVSYSISIMEKI